MSVLDKPKGSNSDVDFLHKRWREVLQELKSDFDKWERHTLKEHILRCAEIAEQRIEAKILDIKKESISSYLYKTLTNEGIQVSDRTIQWALPEIYKRNYSESATVAELRKKKWDVTLDTDAYTIEEDQFHNIKINGIEYQAKPEEKHDISVEVKYDTIPVKQFHTKNHTEYFLEIIRTSKTLIDLANEFFDKGEYDPNVRGDSEEQEKRKRQAESFAITTKKELPNPGKCIDELKSYQAKLNHVGKLTDYRQKIGEFEKVKAIILEKTTYNLAKVAKMLYITPKHLSHNIMKNIDQYLTNLKWFRSIVIKCKSCGKENVVGHADWYNEQIERKTLGLGMLKP